MMQSTKYSLGSSYLDGVIQNASRPFNARSRTARLLGVHKANRKSTFRSNYHQGLFSFAYLNHLPAAYPNAEYQGEFDRLTNDRPRVDVVKHKDVSINEKDFYIGEKDSDYDSAQSVAMPSPKILKIPQEENLRVQMDAKNLGIKASPREPTLGKDNVVTDDGLNAKPPMQGVSQKNLGAKVHVLDDNKNDLNEVPDKTTQENTSDRVVPSVTHKRFQDDRPKKAENKSSIISDLGRMLEANNFPQKKHHLDADKSKDVKFSRLHKTSKSDSVDGMAAAQDGFIDGSPKGGHESLTRRRMETIKKTFQEKYYRSDKPESHNEFAKPEQITTASPSDFEKINMAAPKNPMQNKRNGRTNSNINNKSLKIDSDRFSSEERRFDEDEQMPKKELISKPVQRETIVIERQQSVSVFAELPDAFWERNYLGRSNLRLYK